MNFLPYTPPAPEPFKNEQLGRRLELSAALTRPLDEKVFCGARRRSGITGAVAHACSFHVNHENSHRDVHSGATWS